MIATKSMVSRMKLKIKFPTKRFEAETGTRLCETGHQVSDINCGHSSSDNINVFAAELSKMNSPKPGSKKRGPPGLKEDKTSKRLKMDRRMTQQCSSVLQQLLAHPTAWPFKAPVDPVELNIPDYFSVISEPMDLGTIRSKMDKNMYLSAEEFAADVRLTFSNAMTYNPPDNPIHNYAKRLNNVFETAWKCVWEKWNHESSKVGQGKMSSGQKKEIYNARQNCPKTPPLRNNFLPKRSVPCMGKVVRSSLNARATNADLKTKQKCTRKSEKSFHKGIVSDSRHVCGSKCGSCGNNTCRCSRFSDSTHASSDISSERSLGHDQHACSADALKVDCRPKRPPTSHMSKSDPDSDGAVSTLEDENNYPCSQLIAPATEAASREGWQTPLLDLQLSPKKALRVAMLKSRFADTILKAQQKTLLGHGNKADPVKMQLEKERLERKQCEEKARIEALIKATEAASSQARAEGTELNKQREREREAARIAVQKMEKTVEIDLNLESLRELEMLSGCSPEALEGAHIRSPLERLGLFLKHDYLADEDEEAILTGEGEEGEILL